MPCVIRALGQNKVKERDRLSTEAAAIKTSKSITRRNRVQAYLFLAPNLIGFFIFTFIPVVFAFILSFVEWDSSSPVKFVWLDNFTKLFRDSGFRVSFLNTIIYTAGTVPVIIALSLCLAVALNKGIKGAVIFRAIHFFPYIASIVAIAAVWQFLYHAELGPINQILRSIGFSQPPRWTSSTQWALPAVMLMIVWKSVGYYMIIYLAGLQAIPGTLYEAATIDGASKWKQFWNVTLPLLSPTTFFATIMCIIGSFQVFTPIYVMTGGGPGRATNVLVYKIYVEAFENFQFGYASAISLVLFACIFVVTYIQFKAQEKMVNTVS